MLYGIGSKVSVGTDCFSVKNLQILFSPSIKVQIGWPSQEDRFPPYSSSPYLTDSRVELVACGAMVTGGKILKLWGLILWGRKYDQKTYLLSSYYNLIKRRENPTQRGHLARHNPL